MHLNGGDLDMANCEYRVGSSVTGVKIPEAGRSVSVAVSGGKHICRIQIEEGDVMSPICELPEAGDSDCPIAQFQKGILTIEETNQALTDIFKARRAQREIGVR